MKALGDELLAVTAMLVAIRPILVGLQSSSGQLSWPRTAALLGGGLGSWVGVVGLMAVESHFLGRPFYLPSWLGGTLSFFGGMLGTATLLARRGERGMSEPQALRMASQSLAMSFYLAEPVVSLGFLGATRLLRAALPWTLVRTRWLGVVEGLVLLLLCLLPRDDTHGGLRRVASIGSPAPALLTQPDG